MHVGRPLQCMLVDHPNACWSSPTMHVGRPPLCMGDAPHYAWGMPPTIYGGRPFQCMLVDHSNACWSTTPMHVGRPFQCMLVVHHYVWGTTNTMYGGRPTLCMGDAHHYAWGTPTTMNRLLSSYNTDVWKISKKMVGSSNMNFRPSDRCSNTLITG
jgi:hypothetical protein